jgi:hypothetical protein
VVHGSPLFFHGDVPTANGIAVLAATVFPFSITWAST